MSDPIIDSLNQPPGKKWWQSRTIWGLIATAVSVVAPKYQPVAEILPTVVEQTAPLVTLAYALYGRLKAEQTIKR